MEYLKLNFACNAATEKKKTSALCFFHSIYDGQDITRYMK